MHIVRTVIVCHNLTQQTQMTALQALSWSCRPHAACNCTLTHRRQLLRGAGVPACRYGRGTGAFLTPMYGSGELTQAFCRMAAVHGAVYALRHPVHALHVDAATKACTGIQLASGQVGMSSRGRGMTVACHGGFEHVTG